VQDKQRAGKSRGEAITCAAVSADICPKCQINAQDIWRWVSVRRLAIFLYLDKQAAAGLKTQARQRLGGVSVTRLIRMLQINARGLRHTLLQGLPYFLQAMFSPGRSPG
jgi:hypothetical protein